MKIQHALILAAGRGQRMMPLTLAVPKPMAPYEGTTLIANGIDKIKGHIKYIHITVGYKGAMLASHVIEHGVSTVINTEGKSNSWWIHNTLLRTLNEPMFVLTCDNVVDLDFDRLAEDYFELGSPACMVVPVKPVEGLEGDFIFQTDQVITKISRTEPSGIYCSGIQVLNPFRVSTLAIQRESGSFYDIWSQLIRQKQLYSSRVYPSKWIAIDTVDQLNSAQAITGNSARI
jgi:NDP-sugar pyrophosphorylase family protein